MNRRTFLAALAALPMIRRSPFRIGLIEPPVYGSYDEMPPMVATLPNLPPARIADIYAKQLPGILASMPRVLES